MHLFQILDTDVVSRAFCLSKYSFDSSQTSLGSDHSSQVDIATLGDILLLIIVDNACVLLAIFSVLCRENLMSMSFSFKSSRPNIRHILRAVDKNLRSEALNSCSLIFA